MKTKEELYNAILTKIEEMEEYKNKGSVVEYDIESISFRAKIPSQESQPRITLDFYEEKIKQPKEYNCLKCGKKVVELEAGFDFYEGCLFSMYAGYGSSHDGEEFNVMICDECLDKIKRGMK